MSFTKVESSASSLRAGRLPFAHVAIDAIAELVSPFALRHHRHAVLVAILGDRSRPRPRLNAARGGVVRLLRSPVGVSQRLAGDPAVLTRALAHRRHVFEGAQEFRHLDQLRHQLVFGGAADGDQVRASVHASLAAVGKIGLIVAEVAMMIGGLDCVLVMLGAHHFAVVAAAVGFGGVTTVALLARLDHAVAAVWLRRHAWLARGATAIGAGLWRLGWIAGSSRRVATTTDRR